MMKRRLTTLKNIISENLETKINSRRKRMGAHLMALGVGVWQSIINRYNVPDSFPTDLHGRRLYD